MGRSIVASVVLLAFLLTSVIGPVGLVRAQEVFQLPQPGTRVGLSPAFAPALLKGLKVYPNDPFRLDFILDKGNSNTSSDNLKEESSRLIRYFLASITVPEKDLWVNLSPYEKDRIVPDAFGQTEMGRDLLAQDYLLKQITASVIYPEGEVGKKFWAKVYAEAQSRYGTTDIPVDTFNKVWIVPEKAVVYENKDAAYVVESRLKVMLESDYVALAHQRDKAESSAPAEDVAMSRADIKSAPTTQAYIPLSVGEDFMSSRQEIAKDVLRDVVIPILEKEVNEGQNFAQLRQVYNSLILAVWFKDKIKESIFGKAYVDRDKIAGVDIRDKDEKDKIWARYVESFRKGAYNFIREEKDAASGEMIPRKYFSGGMGLKSVREVILHAKRVQFSKDIADHAMIIRADMSMKYDEETSKQMRKQIVESIAFKKYSAVTTETVGGIADMHDGADLVKKQLETCRFDFKRTGASYFNLLLNSDDEQFPVVKIPKENFSGMKYDVVLKQLLAEANFAKRNMGGIIAPFTIIENLKVNVKRPDGSYEMKTYPLAIVQKRLEMLPFDFSGDIELPSGKKITRDELIQQLDEIGKKLFERGIYYDDKFFAANLGVDPGDGKIYVLDLGSARLAHDWENYIPVPCLMGSGKQGHLQFGTDRKIVINGNHSWRSMQGQAANRTFDVVLPDSASQTATGGIDLTRDRMNVQINSQGKGVPYTFDPAMIQRLENATGITPTIIDIRPMTMTVQSFMGVE